jgi:pyruvate dehydrogenase E2 component (dihydrolipoamide acetyltransferase)
MAEAMAKVAREVVAASLMDEAIVETWAAGIDPTTRLVRAMVAGCQAAPSLNAWFDPVGRSRRLHDHIDLGIALESADGLFVPVIRNVAGRGPEDLRGALQTLKRQVSERSIARADLQGQTITLSNFGMLGGRHAVLTVMPPQVAILGAGRIHRAVRPLGEEIKVVSVLPLSLSFDHRAVTGAEACAFMAAAVADLSKSS